LLEGNGRHERFRRELVPRRDIRDGRNHDDVENKTDDDGRPDSAEISARTEFGICFLGGLGDRFVSGHEVRNDLQDENNRNERSMREKRREICGRAFGNTAENEHDEECERAECSPVLKGCAQADTAIVENGEQEGESEADREMRKVDGLSVDLVKLDGIERRKNVSGDAADGIRWRS